MNQKKSIDWIQIIDDYFLGKGYIKKNQVIDDYIIKINYESKLCELMFTLENKEFIPDMLIHLKNKNNKMEDRKTYNQILEKIVTENYRIYTFYLSEIIEFNNLDYVNLFDDIFETKRIIEKFIELLNKYGINYILGEKNEFIKLQKWFSQLP